MFLKIFSTFFSILFLFGCFSSKPPGPVKLRSQENLHGCNLGRLSSRLTQGPAGSVVEELKLKVNCPKRNSKSKLKPVAKITDFYGRKWHVDKSGNLVVPAKLSEDIFFPPALETWKIDSVLASRLYSQKYYKRSMRQLLSILQLSLEDKQKLLIRNYFCRLWTKLNKKGGSWEKLLRGVSGGSWKEKTHFRFFNYAFDFTVDYPLNYRIVVKKFPVDNKGDIILVSLKLKADENKKDVVLLFSTDNPKIKLEKFFNLGNEGWVKKGDKKIQKKEGFVIQKKIITKNKPYLKIMMIQVGTGENKILSRISKSLSRRVFKDPCLESAEK